MFKRFLQLLFGKSKKPRNPRSKSNDSTSSYTMREGKLVETDDVFEAWTSKEFAKMIEALDSSTNLIDRHFLLMGIVDDTYKQRKDNPEMKKICARISERHIEEFPQIREALLKDMDGFLPRVTTFQKYATLLTEEGNYQKAIEVCEIALSHGLKDGTKTGFKGRIERIKKKVK